MDRSFSQPLQGLSVVVDDPLGRSRPRLDGGCLGGGTVEDLAQKLRHRFGRQARQSLPKLLQLHVSHLKESLARPGPRPNTSTKGELIVTESLVDLVREDDGVERHGVATFTMPSSQTM